MTMSDTPNTSEEPKASDQLPEEGPAEQVPDDVPHAHQGAAREAGSRYAQDAARDAHVSDPRFERLQADEAAAEAARIGGVAGDEQLDPAERPVIEAGGGEAEGFEQAESVLIEHATHGDQQSAHTILHDQGRPEEPDASRENGEADHEHSSERPEDERW
jgi:hypothetical protein